MTVYFASCWSSREHFICCW